MNKKQLQKIVERCISVSLKDGKISEAKVKQCIKLLKQLPRDEAVMSLELFVRGLRRNLDQTTLTIESAVKLPSTLVAKVTRSLSRDFKITQSRSILNPSLLGGLRIKIGDVVIDDSVSARINQLKERIGA